MGRVSSEVGLQAWWWCRKVRSPHLQDRAFPFHAQVTPEHLKQLTVLLFIYLFSLFGPLENKAPQSRDFVRYPIIVILQVHGKMWKGWRIG